MQPLEYSASNRTPLPAIQILGNLDTEEASLGSHRNIWPAIGLPGQLYKYLVTWTLNKLTLAAMGILASCRNTWAPIGIPQYLVAWRLNKPTWAAIGISGQL